VHAPGSTPADSGRLLRWIAVERALRTVLLLGVGIVLLTHPHTDWAGEISHLARRLGLDPNANWVRKLVAKVREIGPRERTLFGVVALAFAVLEGTEAYGLWKRRRWAEWLTVLATSLLIVPEVWELTRSVTPLKLGGLIVNILVVAYLVWRLRAHTPR